MKTKIDFIVSFLLIYNGLEVWFEKVVFVKFINNS